MPADPAAAPPDDEARARDSDRPGWQPPRSDLPLNFGLTFLLAVVGQVALLRGTLWLGLACYAAAGVALLILVREIEVTPPPRLPCGRPPRAGPLKATFWFTSLALCLFTTWHVNTDLPRLQDYALAASWLVSLLAVIWSALQLDGWRWPGWAVLSRQARKHGPEALGVGLIVLLALALRIYDLSWHPYAFINDEAEVGHAAMEIIRGVRTNFFETGWSSQPIWSFIPTALAIQLAGPAPWAVRLTSTAAGTLSVLFVYLLAREIFDRPVALLSAGVLLALPWHLQFSRLGVNNIVDSAFAPGVLWLTFRALRRGHFGDYAWAGLAAGLTIYTYPGSRLVLALAVGTLVLAGLRQRDFLRSHLRQLAVFGAALGIAAAPMAAYFIRHPDIFMARTNGASILINGWLQAQARAAGESHAAILLDQLRASSLVYVAEPALGQFFNSPQPYLTPLAAIFFFFGLAYCLGRLRDSRHTTILAWLFSVVILGSTLTLYPPSHQRLIMSAPAVALLVALGLRQVMAVGQAIGPRAGRAGLALCAGVVVVSGLQGTAFYFGEYRQGHYFEIASDEVSYEASRHAASLGAGYRLFLLGSPSVYKTFANFRYNAPQVDVDDFNAVTAATIAALPRDRGALFVAIPARRGDLEYAARQLPGGQWTEVPRRFQGPEILYYAYQLSPEQFALP